MGRSVCIAYMDADACLHPAEGAVCIVLHCVSTSICMAYVGNDACLNLAEGAVCTVQEAEEQLNQGKIGNIPEASALTHKQVLEMAVAEASRRVQEATKYGLHVLYMLCLWYPDTACICFARFAPWHYHCGTLTRLALP